MFFIIWRGWGIAVIGAWLLSAAIFTIGSEEAFGHARAIAIQTWMAGPVCLLAAALIFLLARRLNPTEPRVLIDKLSGREVVLRRRHELFFIDIKYWVWIMAALGVALTAWKLLGKGA